MPGLRAVYSAAVRKPPATWPTVLETEYRALHGTPPFDGPGPDDPDERLHALHARLHARNTSALCLSGGGIRSATFALGVLQGLARAGVLGSIDYLSTVSGGGYIGGWFTAWLHREGTAGRAAVLDAIDPGRRMHNSECDPADDVASPIDRVRQTCRYLAPTGGAVSADVWTLVVTLTRNLLLNWLVILPLLAASLTVMRVYYVGLQRVERPFTSGPCLVAGDAAWWSIIGVFAGFAISTLYVVLNFVGFGARWSQQRFLIWFLTPAMAAAVAMTFFWSAYPCRLNLRDTVFLAAAIPVLGWIALGAVSRMFLKMRPGDGATLRIRVGIRTILAAIAGGQVIGGGIWYLCTFEYGFGAGDQLRQLYAVFGVPVVLGLALVQMMVFVGIASSELDDAVLEWWSRCGAWLAIAASVWMAGGILILYLADLIEWIVSSLSHAMPAVGHTPMSAIVAALVPLLSSLAGIAARAGGQTGKPSFARVTFQKVALPLIIVVLLATIAWADLRLSDALGGHALPLGIALAALGLTASAFVPVNRFSLHGMYQQRLIRTFLGASRRDRSPNVFTGFDRNDDLRVHQLKDVRPLHVINTTLNARSSTDMGRNEISAQSFSFTPFYVGNRDVGYRAAHEYGSDRGANATGLSLGMALAVSGAAASPAMGMYSTKSRAFLLTLANARLGLWFGNPQSERRWQKSEPAISVAPLMRELLGLTTDRNPYVYLSDGGHYENLGLWEMVARRNRYIIVSDAGCDPTYTFDDLGNAVRRIRLDLGIPILFPSLDITKAGQGTTNPHAAVGKILYSVVDGPDAPDGTILYIKATLSGDEPIDVRNFASGDPEFPHDTTANQFFDEARFESYRTLGYQSVLSVTGGLRNLTSVSAFCDVARSTLAAPTPVLEPPPPQPA
jgi:hypothetical protein